MKKDDSDKKKTKGKSAKAKNSIKTKPENFQGGKGSFSAQ